MANKTVPTQEIPTPFNATSLKRVEVNWKERKIKLIGGAGITAAGLALLPFIGSATGLSCGSGLVLFLRGGVESPSLLKGAIKPLVRVRVKPTEVAEKMYEAFAKTPFDSKNASPMDRAAHDILLLIAKDEGKDLAQKLRLFQTENPKNYPHLLAAAKELSHILNRQKDLLAQFESPKFESTMTKKERKTLALGAAGLVAAGGLYALSDPSPSRPNPSSKKKSKFDPLTQSRNDPFRKPKAPAKSPLRDRPARSARVISLVQSFQSSGMVTSYSSGFDLENIEVVLPFTLAEIEALGPLFANNSTKSLGFAGAVSQIQTPASAYLVALSSQQIQDLQSVATDSPLALGQASTALSAATGTGLAQQTTQRDQLHLVFLTPDQLEIAFLSMALSETPIPSSLAPLLQYSGIPSLLAQGTGAPKTLAQLSREKFGPVIPLVIEESVRPALARKLLLAMQRHKQLTYGSKATPSIVVTIASPQAGAIAAPRSALTSPMEPLLTGLTGLPQTTSSEMAREATAFQPSPFPTEPTFFSSFPSLIRGAIWGAPQPPLPLSVSPPLELGIAGKTPAALPTLQQNVQTAAPSSISSIFLSAALAAAPLILPRIAQCLATNSSPPLLTDPTQETFGPFEDSYRFPQQLYSTRPALKHFGEHLLRPSALLALANLLGLLRVSATLLKHKICCQNVSNLTARSIIGPATPKNQPAALEAPPVSLRVSDQGDVWQDVELNFLSPNGQCPIAFNVSLNKQLQIASPVKKISQSGELVVQSEGMLVSFGHLAISIASAFLNQVAIPAAKLLGQTAALPIHGTRWVVKGAAQIAKEIGEGVLSDAKELGANLQHDLPIWLEEGRDTGTVVLENSLNAAGAATSWALRNGHWVAGEAAQVAKETGAVALKKSLEAAGAATSWTLKNGHWVAGEAAQVTKETGAVVWEKSLDAAGAATSWVAEQFRSQPTTVSPQKPEALHSPSDQIKTTRNVLSVEPTSQVVPELATQSIPAFLPAYTLQSPPPPPIDEQPHAAPTVTLRDRLEITRTVLEEKNRSGLEDFSAADSFCSTRKEKSSRDEWNFPSRSARVISGRSLTPSINGGVSMDSALATLDVEKSVLVKDSLPIATENPVVLTTHPNRPGQYLFRFSNLETYSAINAKFTQWIKPQSPRNEDSEGLTIYGAKEKQSPLSDAALAQDRQSLSTLVVIRNPEHARTFLEKVAAEVAKQTAASHPTPIQFNPGIQLTKAPQSALSSRKNRLWTGRPRSLLSAPFIEDKSLNETTCGIEFLPPTTQLPFTLKNPDSDSAPAHAKDEIPNRAPPVSPSVHEAVVETTVPEGVAPVSATVPVIQALPEETKPPEEEPQKAAPKPTTAPEWRARGEKAKLARLALKEDQKKFTASQKARYTARD